MNKEKAIHYLLSLRKPGKKYGLRRIQALMKVLGSPEKGMRFIHVTGTNGKGSTCSFIYSVLLKSGYKAGLYSSPHLIDFNERIQLNGKSISDGQLVKLVKEVREILETHPRIKPSFFEFLTGATIYFFAKKKPDFVVLEAGLGGRLDATNVVKSDAAVITNVGREHAHVLGKKIASIAFEKAGIIKHKTCVVTAAKNKQALKVIREKAREMKAKAIVVGKDVEFKKVSENLGSQVFSYHGKKFDLKNLKINFFGKHQLANASTAIAALECLNLKKVNEKAIREGLKEAHWPGRFEFYRKKPPIVFDVAHNLDGFRILRRELEDFKDKKIKIVVGCSSDKNYKLMVREISPLLEKAFVTSAKLRARNPKHIAREFRNHGVETEIIPDVAEAFKTARKGLKEGELLTVCGSIFVIREAKKSVMH